METWIGYIVDHTRPEILKVPHDELLEIHHKGWINEALFDLNESDNQDIFEEESGDCNFMFCQIPKEEFNKLALEAAEYYYSRLYSKKSLKEFLKGNWDYQDAELNTFWTDTQDSAVLDKCFAFIKRKWKASHPSRMKG